MMLMASLFTSNGRIVRATELIVAMASGLVLTATLGCNGDQTGNVGGEIGGGFDTGSPSDLGNDDPGDPDTAVADALDDTSGISDGESTDGTSDPDGCSVKCNPGQSRCTNDGEVQTCIQTNDGCGRWSLPTACMERKVCVAGVCEEATACQTKDPDCPAHSICRPDASAPEGYTCECTSGYVQYQGTSKTACYSNESHAVVEDGSFQMGSPSGETGRETDESRHQVTISRPFVIGYTELRRGNWGAHFQTPPGTCNSPGCPVSNVSWWGALKYANKASDRAGLETCYQLQGCSGTPGDDFSCSSVTFEGVSCLGWRLPTEAEWEKAARAGTSEATYNGDIADPQTSSVVGEIAWYQGNSGGKPHSPGGKLANSLNLVDTSGNLAEWVWDRYGSYPAGPVTDPTGPSSGGNRVIRGGHWDSNAAACRSAARAKTAPDTRNDKIGFRLVRTLSTD